MGTWEGALPAPLSSRIIAPPPRAKQACGGVFSSPAKPEIEAEGGGRHERVPSEGATGGPACRTTARLEILPLRTDTPLFDYECGPRCKRVRRFYWGLPLPAESTVADYYPHGCSTAVEPGPKEKNSLPSPPDARPEQSKKSWREDAGVQSTFRILSKEKKKADACHRPYSISLLVLFSISVVSIYSSYLADHLPPNDQTGRDGYSYHQR